MLGLQPRRQTFLLPNPMSTSGDLFAIGSGGSVRFTIHLARPFVHDIVFFHGRGIGDQNAPRVCSPSLVDAIPKVGETPSSPHSYSFIWPHPIMAGLAIGVVTQAMDDRFGQNGASKVLYRCRHGRRGQGRFNRSQQLVPGERLQ